MPADASLIDKTARDTAAFARPYRLFANARSALKALLASLDFRPGEQVLLPAYVGWSAKEGSGVFDPVAELNLPYGFYRVNGRLHVDLNDLENRLRAGGVKALALIHYFGYVDPRYGECVRLARRHGTWVIEDKAQRAVFRLGRRGVRPAGRRLHLLSAQDASDAGRHVGLTVTTRRPAGTDSRRRG